VKHALLAFALLAPLSTQLASADPYVDPCTDPEVVQPNSWFIGVNDGDTTSREGLLTILRLLATGGFATEDIFGYDFTPDITFYVTFDPGYWNSPDRAEQVKNETLGAIGAVEGTSIRCNPLAFPAGAPR
jgi:hypothetical protein